VLPLGVSVRLGLQLGLRLGLALGSIFYIWFISTKPTQYCTLVVRYYYVIGGI